MEYLRNRCQGLNKRSESHFLIFGGTRKEPHGKPTEVAKHNFNPYSPPLPESKYPILFLLFKFWLQFFVSFDFCRQKLWDLSKVIWDRDSFMVLEKVIWDRNSFTVLEFLENSFAFWSFPALILLEAFICNYVCWPQTISYIIEL